MKKYFYTLLLYFSFTTHNTLLSMPMFARKYKAECMMCHAAVPRLNATGFEFKAAGYRMPWEIGQEQDESVFQFGNFNAFVSVVNAQYQSSLNNPNPDNLQMNAQELDVHPMTGSWKKNWGSGFEGDVLPNGTVNLNQGFITYTLGDNSLFATLEAGLIPNYLGFGVLDRPIAVTTPLLLSMSAQNPTQDTLFTWANPRAAGISGSLIWEEDTYVNFSFRNHLEDTSNGLDALGSSNNTMGDFLISITEFIDRTKGSGSALSLFYYRGQSTIPISRVSSNTYQNNFNHLGFAVNYYIDENWNPLAGFGWGEDQASGGGHIYSNGYFAALEYFLSPTFALGTRFDMFHSDLNISGTWTEGGTLYVYYHPIDEIILSFEYQYLKNGFNTQALGGDETTGTLQAIVAF